VRSVLVVGAGALGSVYGAFFARAGLDVELLAREPHARAVQEQGGLRLAESGVQELVPMRAEWRPERVGPADLVVLATKTPATRRALDDVDHVRAGLSLALSLQNGIEKDDALIDWCGRDRVLGAVSMVGGTMLEPGLAEHTFRGRTIVGELGGGTSPRVEELAAAVARGGHELVVSADVRSVEWMKLVHAIPTMALTALPRLYFHEALLSPQLARAYVALAREGARVAEASGAVLDDESVLFPLRSIVTAPEAEAVELVHARGRRMRDAGMTEVLVSMLGSVQSRTRLEVEEIFGWIVREAARLDIPVPSIELCYLILSGLDDTFAA
jgi:2-dehydropantoate 2-reductase